MTSAKQQKKLTLIASAVLIAALLIALVAFISSGTASAAEGITIPDVSATEGADGQQYLEIVAANLLYTDYLHIAYAIDMDLPEGAKAENLKMLFWKSAAQEYTKDSDGIIHVSYVDGKENTLNNSITLSDGTSYGNVAEMISMGIAAKEIGDTFYARAYLTDAEGNDYYSNVVKYSVFEYVQSRYDEKVAGYNVTDTQMKLYGRILKYGEAAQLQFGYRTNRLVTGAVAHVEVEKGHITDGFTSGYYLEGDTISLYADEENGLHFSHWEDSKGNAVSSDKLFNLKITKESDGEVYTAVYGNYNPTAEVLPVKGGASGIVSIVHDDGNIDTVYELEKIFYKYGLVGNLALMSNNGKTTNRVPKWKEIIGTGRWKVASHSATHTWWGTATDNGDGTYTFADNPTKVNDEIVNSQKILRELFPGQRVLAFVYPGFAAEKNTYVGAYSPAMGTDKYNKILEFIYSPASRQLIAENYIGARYDSILKGNEAYVDDVRDFYYMNGGFINTGSYTSGNIAARLEDAANGGFHLFSLHTCGDGGEITVQAMDGVAAMIREYVDDGKIWNTYYEDALLYVKEAQNSTVSVSGNESKITVTLTDTLDDSIYDYALTVRVNAPEGWTAAKVIQGESVSYVKVKTVDGNRVVDCDIVPDKGAAIITPIAESDLPEAEQKAPALPIGPEGPFDPNAPVEPEVPEEPETPEVPDDTYVPNPNLALDSFINFETNPGVTAGSASAVEFVARDNGLALKVLDNSSNMGSWTVPFGKTVTADAFSFTFDLNVKSASAGFNSDFFFANTSSSPYMIALTAAGSSYSLGDCQSNSGGAGKQTTGLSGTLSYNTWYTIKIDVVINGDDGFKATWYVKDANGSFVKTGESTNFCNIGRTEGAVPQNTLSYFGISSLGGATVEMYFDNMFIKAGDLKQLGFVEPDLKVEQNFNGNTGGATSAGNITYTSEAPEGSTNKALKVEKTSGYQAVSFKATNSLDPTGEFIFSFDINVATASTTVAQIVFNSTLANTPYDLTILPVSGGYRFGDLSNSSGGTSTAFDGKTLEFNKTYSVKLHVVLGDKDNFLATLYVDGEEVGTSTNYYKVNGSSNDPYTAVNGVSIHWQSAATFTLYIDNLSLKAYSPEAPETPVEPEAPTQPSLPSDSAVKDGYLSFSDSAASQGFKGNAHKVQDGKLYTDTPSDWATTTFLYDGYSASKTFETGAQYIFEGEYTYLGGTLPSDTSGVGFIGFLNEKGTSNKSMRVADYIKYPGVDANGDGIQDYVSFFGTRFNLGETYNLKFVFTSGTLSIDVYVDGELVNTYVGKATSTMETDNVLYGFGIYYRSADRIGDYKACFDNVKVSAVGTVIAKDFSETLSNGHKLDRNFFPGFVRKTVSFTLDDGIYQHDKRVVEILKPAGFTGTFNINNPATVTDPTIYEGFEIANHNILHAVAMKDEYAAREFVDSYLPNDADTTKVYKASRTVDGETVEGFYYVYIGGSWHPMASNETYVKYLEWTTKELEKIFGEGTVVGFAYPHGNQYNDYVINYLKEKGYLYGRRTGNLKDTTGFALPADRFTWTYNADHNCLLSVMADFDNYGDDGQLKMFSFGVHAKDFETSGKWGDLETFARLYGNRQDEFWYATNRQIFEYEDALKALVITDAKITNPSDIDVYVKIDGEKVVIEANSDYIF